jgi:hypothetical protein
MKLKFETLLPNPNRTYFSPCLTQIPNYHCIDDQKILRIYFSLKVSYYKHLD